MIDVSSIIARVTALRTQAATEALANPNSDKPEFGYGMAVGRDSAFALVLEAITMLLEADANEEDE